MSIHECLSNGWSIVTSSPTNSQLAGLLAGFVLTGILMLLGRPGHKNIQTLGLFCAAFIVLGFDSYQFSSLSGSGEDSACVRVWSQGMAASGMLAVGSLSIVSGIGWLLSTHIDDIREFHRRAATSEVKLLNLNLFGRVMVIGVATAISLLLAITTIDYIDFVFSERAPGWLSISVWVTPICLGVVATVIVYRVKSSSTDQRERRGPVKALNVSAFGVLVYGVTGPVFSGVLSQLPAGEVGSPAVPIVAGSMIVGLVIPGALLAGLVSAFPLLRLPVGDPDISNSATED